MLCLKPMGTKLKNASKISKKVLEWHWIAVAEPILHELGTFDLAKEKLGRETLPFI